MQVENNDEMGKLMDILTIWIREKLGICGIGNSIVSGEYIG